jgi:hypothetical protein
MAGACRIVFVVSLVGVDAVVSGSRIMTNIAVAGDSVEVT